MGVIALPVDVAERVGAHHVGADIRALRRSRNLSLTELSADIGRSVGWLSQVERGQTEPGIADLRRIAQRFGAPISFFFRNDDAPEHERGVVVRAGARATLGSRREGLTEELLSPNLSGDFEMIRSVFEPNSASEPIPARPTHEGGYVVSGALTLWIGERRFDLAAGDSFQFRNASYRWENAGDVAAVVVWIVSPPVY